jgi:AmmeMemoRadiSam system protein B
MDCPKLRPVEAIPTADKMICLRDPQGFSDKLVFLPYEAFFIVSLFDGRHSILDIQAEYTRRFGELLFSDKVHEIIEKLDSCLFLESGRFQEVMKKAVQEFRKAKVRRASHAGSGYESEHQALVSQIGGLFTSSEGPGLPEAEPRTGRMRGLIAPHIDIRRGGLCFAWSYAELAKECRATTFVILGISHVQTRKRFVLTDKDFETPLGVVAADRDFITGLTRKCDNDFFEDEFVHRGEHSVEFQTVFLRYLFPDKKELKIVPILCSFGEEVYSGGSPADEPEFVEFTAALRDVLEEKEDRVCFIAGVDLSHLGRRFGQNVSMTSGFLRQAEADDRAMIDKILELDAEGFFGLIQEEKDRRNVCGVPAIYTLLRALDVKSARLLRYDQSVDNATQSVVTFMGAAFYA